MRRRLLVETAAWIAGVTAWVILGRSSGVVIFGTGLATAAFGVVQLLWARAHVGAVERSQGVSFFVSDRPALGTPDLTSVRTRPR